MLTNLLELADYYPVLLLLPFLFFELRKDGRAYRTPRAWRLRALLVSAAALGVSLFVGRLWVTVLPHGSLFDGSSLGTVGGAIVGVVVYELGHYGYHRAAHRFDWLWRAGHQLHHSAESLDAFGAYFLHPLDAMLFTSIGIVVSFPLLGLSPEAGAITAAFLAFNAVFQHANIATPRWLGYLIQRPESHGVHHERGVHAYNYCDLPLWDLVFGTFRNPKEAPAQAGFWIGASTRIADMLVFRSVSDPPAAAIAAPAPVSSAAPLAAAQGAGR